MRAGERLTDWPLPGDFETVPKVPGRGGFLPGASLSRKGDIMARGNGDWSKARQYLEKNPGATSGDIIKNAGITNTAAAYQVIAAARKPKKGTAGKALKKFKAVRANLKRKGLLPGGDPATAPLRLTLEMDNRGVELAIRNGHGRIGTLEISPAGAIFIEGKGVRSTERIIPWNLLASLQGFTSQVGE